MLEALWGLDESVWLDCCQCQSIAKVWHRLNPTASIAPQPQSIAQTLLKAVCQVTATTCLPAQQNEICSLQLRLQLAFRYAGPRGKALAASYVHAVVCILCVFKERHGRFGAPSAIAKCGQNKLQTTFLMQWHVIRHDQCKVTVDQAPSQH